MGPNPAEDRRHVEIIEGGVLAVASFLFGLGVAVGIDRSYYAGLRSNPPPPSTAPWVARMDARTLAAGLGFAVAAKFADHVPRSNQNRQRVLTPES